LLLGFTNSANISQVDLACTIGRHENIHDGLRDLKTGLDLDRAERKKVVVGV